MKLFKKSKRKHYNLRSELANKVIRTETKRLSGAWSANTGSTAHTEKQCINVSSGIVMNLGHFMNRTGSVLTVKELKG